MNVARLLHHISGVFILRLSTAVFAVISNIILARQVGPEGVGLYYLAFSISLIATIIARFGMDNVILRYTAIAVAERDSGMLGGLYKSALRLGVVASTFITITLIYFSPWIEHVMASEQLSKCIVLISLSIIPMTILIIHTEILKGFDRYNASIAISTFGVQLVYLALLPILMRVWGVHGACVAYTSSVTFNAIVSIIARRRLPITRFNNKSIFLFKQLLNSAIPLFIVALAEVVLISNGTVMLGWYSDEESVGIFRITLRLAMLTTFTIFAVNVVVSPTFSRLYHQNKKVELRRMVRTSALLAGLLSLPVLIGFTVYPEQVLTVFGDKFVAGSESLIVLTIGQFIAAVVGPTAAFLVTSGNEKVFRIILLATVCINVVANYLLIPRFGTNGAAFALAASVVVQSILSLVIVKKIIRPRIAVN